VCALTALVGYYNYTIVCKHFPDGGGVYSAARSQSRLLAAIGALLLLANFLVTAALSCNSAMYLLPGGRSAGGRRHHAVHPVVGAINYFGPETYRSLAVVPGCFPMVFLIAW